MSLSVKETEKMILLVRTSGRELSMILLFGTFLSFMATFVIVSKPGIEVCAITRFSVGFCYTGKDSYIHNFAITSYVCYSQMICPCCESQLLNSKIKGSIVNKTSILLFYYAMSMIKDRLSEPRLSN